MENSNNAPMLLHSTYFNLGTSNTQGIVEAYMAEARQYLSESVGMISFWIGIRADDMIRPENDLNYDIAMHQLFVNEDAFNIYNSNDSAHNQFVIDVNRWVPRQQDELWMLMLRILLLAEIHQNHKLLVPMEIIRKVCFMTCISL